MSVCQSAVVMGVIQVRKVYSERKLPPRNCNAVICLLPTNVRLDEDNSKI